MSKKINMGNPEYAIVSEDGIRVAGHRGVGYSSVGVVTVLPGIQIRLGWFMESFADVIHYVKKPIGVEKIVAAKTHTLWQISKLWTENTKEEIICTVTAVKGKIIGVTYNQDLIYNEHFREYQSLSMLHLLTAGHSSDTRKTTKAIQGIAAITGLKAQEISVVEIGERIIVNTLDKLADKTCQYIFCKDKHGYYNMLSVGYELIKLN